MRKQFWKQYGTKFFALFVVIIMIAVVYPVLVQNAKNPSQLSAYEDDWNDISQFANDIDKDGDGKHEIKTIVSSPSILNKIAEVEKNSTDPTINANETILVIIGVERSYSEYDSKAIHEFVKAGGKVVLADDSGYGNTAFYGEGGTLDIGMKLRPNIVQEGCAPTQGDTFFGKVAEEMNYGSADPKCKPARLYDSQYFDEYQSNSIVVIDAEIDRMGFDGQLMMSTPGALVVKSSKAEELAHSSQLGFVDLNQNGEGDSGEGTWRDNLSYGVPVVAEANVGSGKVIFISDTSIFSNQYYSQLGNRDFILSIIEYLSDGEKQTIIFDESRHIQSDLISLIYVQLFGILGYVSSNESLGILFLGSIILLLQLAMLRVENPKPWRHMFNIYEGRLSRFRVPHAHYTHPETMKEVFIDKVRITHGFSREEFEMLPPSKLEEMVKDTVLIRFIINNEKNMTLKEVEESIRGWKK